MNKKYSRNLLRNIRKSLGDDFLKDILDEKHSSEKIKQDFWPVFLDFLEKISSSYDRLEEEVEISKNNIDLSSSELNEARDSLLAMAESLGQGFFMVNKDFKCLPYYTKICTDLTGKEVPVFKDVFSYLNLKAQEEESLKVWMQAFFQDDIDNYEILLPLCPLKLYPHSEKHIQIEIKPSQNMFGKIDKLIFCLTDKTEEFKANLKADEKTKESLLVAHISENKNSLSNLVTYVKDFYETQSALYEREDIMNSQDLKSFKRFFHSLKGISAQLQIISCLDFIKTVEEKIYSQDISYKDILKDVKSYKEILDEFLFKYFHVLGPNFSDMNKYASIHKMSLKNYLATKSKNEEYDFIKNVLSNPASHYLKNLNEQSLELSQKLNKLVAPIKIHGGDTKIFIDPYQNLFMSFVHIIRNILDHGIELPSDRKQKGKSNMGHISVHVESFEKNSESWFRLRFEDDGQGVDLEKIRQKNPLLNEKDDDFVMQEIFKPNLSTKDIATDISGRGVGLDVIKDEVEQLGGKVWVESEKNKYCRINIEVPQIWEFISSTETKTKTAA